MGRTGSSSKRKSSKRKKSKISSETRRRKTSRRNKSKKLHRRDDSSSYSDDSTRSLSISSSDSEIDYKSRKSRSRVRDDVKHNRKRARRSSSSRESSVDSLRIKKRKRTKRDGESKVRKKFHKKKPRRKASISSSSSDSRSCSPRRHGNSSDSEESEIERIRGRSREKKNRRNPGNSKSGNNKSKKRSRSCSSCSRYSNSIDDHSKEKVECEINSRRLRSVIIVARPLREKEETEMDKDEHKEEIVYDQDDYTSCKSNDSNGGRKRDLANIASEKRRKVENVTGKEDFVSKLTSKESRLSAGDRSDQYDEIESQFDTARLKNSEKENEVDASATTAVSGGDNLESILRQKALENLRRFRGRPQTNAETPTHHENKIESNSKLCTAMSDLSSGVTGTQSVDPNSRPTLRKDSSYPIQIDKKNLDGRESGIESKTSTPRVVTLSSEGAISGKPKDQDQDYTTAHTANNKSESSTSALRQKALDNLRRFRGGPRTNAGTLTRSENEIESNAKSCTVKSDLSSGVTETQSVDPDSMPILRKDSSDPMQTDEKNLDERDSGIESRAAKLKVSLPNEGAISGNPAEKDYASAHIVNNNSESSMSVLRQKSLGTGSSLKQVPPSDVSLEANLQVTKNIINKSAAQTSQTVAESSSNNQSLGVIDARDAAPEPSYVKPISEDQSSRAHQGESKPNSQFEQKTMSVMRGGEMVQVSYKVYIPTKAPALARRKLQR